MKRWGILAGVLFFTSQGVWAQNKDSGKSYFSSFKNWAKKPANEKVNRATQDQFDEAAVGSYITQFSENELYKIQYKEISPALEAEHLSSVFQALVRRFEFSLNPTAGTYLHVMRQADALIGSIFTSTLYPCSWGLMISVVSSFSKKETAASFLEINLSSALDKSNPSIVAQIIDEKSVTCFREIQKRSPSFPFIESGLLLSIFLQEKLEKLKISPEQSAKFLSFFKEERKENKNLWVITTPPRWQ